MGVYPVPWKRLRTFRTLTSSFILENAATFVLIAVSEVFVGSKQILVLKLGAMFERPISGLRLMKAFNRAIFTDAKLGSLK